MNTIEKAKNFKEKAESLIDQFNDLIETMPDNGDVSDESQKILLMIKTKELLSAINGVNHTDFINSKMKELVNEIQKRQNDIEWEFYPEYEVDYSMDENELKTKSIEELIEINDMMFNLQLKDEERYESEFIKHGRAE